MGPAMPTEAEDRLRSQFRPLFEPRSIAIVGASNSNPTRANDVLEFALGLGFAGKVYPIHPTAEKIAGFTAYRSFADCPTDIDYAFIAIAASKVPDLLENGGDKVRFAQIMSSGFGETSEGEALNARLLDVARRKGVRLIGPNCLGTYSPRGGLSYIRDSPTQAGPVGVAMQSGGLSTDMLRRGVQRGLRYSAVVSMGNCADLGPTDFLEYFLADPHTRVIGFYLESLTEGRRFFEALRSAKAAKPVVILKGGRTRQGQRTASTHTGALGGDDRLWTALSRQTGAILVDTIDELIDTLLTFQCVTPRLERPGDGAFLVGNGGGASVLATDQMARLSMRIRDVSAAGRAALEAMRLPPGTSINNPLDAPSGALRMDDGRISSGLLRAILGAEQPDALVFHINMPQFLTNPSIPQSVLENLVAGAIEAHAGDAARTPMLLVLRSDGSAAIDARKREARARAQAAGIPVFDEILPALAALRRFQQFEQFALRKQAPGPNRAPGAH
jgi:acyl-CoA synthetase (NDP forming)